MTKDLKPASDSSQKIAAKIQKNQRKTAKYETLKNQVEAIEKNQVKLSLLSDAADQQMEGQRKRKHQPDFYSFFKKWENKIKILSFS